MLWPFLIGAVAGCGLTLLTIFSEFKVSSKKWWERRHRERTALDSCLHEAVAENARLWVARAAGDSAAAAEEAAGTGRQALDDAEAASQDGASPSWTGPSLIISSTRS